MNVAVVADIVALIAFGTAAVFVLRAPVGAPRVGRMVKYTMLAVAGIYAVVSVSNVLEHAGITAALDVYEDFLEVLFLPTVAWAIFSRLAAERLVTARSAEEAIRSEHELLTRIVETTPTGILVADAEGSITFANDVAERMLDKALDGQIDLRSLVRSAPGTRPRVQLGEGSTAEYLAVRSSALTHGADGPERAVLVLADVTDRAQLEVESEKYRRSLEHAIDRRTGELLEANRQLEQAGDERQSFLAKMSHELRTPLNSIIGFSEIILKGLSGPLTDEQTKQLGMVRNSGRQLLDIVNDVLEISRVEAGYNPVSIVQVDVGARMRDLVDSMNPVADAHEVALEQDCPNGPPVSTDPDRLDQIVRNLITNALKFTDPGGRVVVTVAHDADSTAVSVTDNGIGIAREDQERIFDAFQQVDTPNRARPEGTGLGLVICRELAGALGCALTVDSTPGEGSVFTVVVPSQFPGHQVIL